MICTRDNEQFLVIAGQLAVRCAVENDVFASLPQDSLLVELGMGY